MGTRALDEAVTSRRATEAIAEFIVALDLSAIPDGVLHEAKRSLVDHLAVTLAGAGEPASRRLRRVAQRLAPTTQATIVGSAERTSAPFAALLNGYSAHVLDFDDTYNPGRTTIHGSASVWPVIFALSDLSRLSGRRAVESFVAGFETQARVASAAGPAHYEIGWHVTGTAGHVGAAAAAAKVLELPADATVHALGCAATQAAGLKELYGSDCKALHPGKAAMDGVLSGFLADEGFTAVATSLEGRQGLLSVMSTDPEPKLLVDGLNATWHLADNGYKPYPSGSLTHPTVDALLALQERFDFSAREVAGVDVRVHTYAATVTGNRSPTTGNQAKFSLVHCAAMALLRRRLTLAEFEDAVVNDADVARTRDKVSVAVDPSQGKRSAAVTVTLQDGRRLDGSVLDNRGTPANPLRDVDLEQKFLAVAVPKLGEGAARSLMEQCWRLEQVDDLAAVVAVSAGVA